MRKGLIASSLAGFSCTFLACTAFSAGAPTLMMLLLKHVFGVPSLFILLGLRVVSIILYSSTGLSAVLIGFVAFMLGAAEGAMFQALLFYSAILFLSIPLLSVKVLLVALGIPVALGTYALARGKRYSIAYAFAIYALVIPLGTRLDASIWKVMKRLQPRYLKLCGNFRGEARAIFSYPSCLNGSYADICRKLFEEGAPYDSILHEKTGKLVVTGRDSGLLLIFDTEGLHTIDLQGAALFLTYDPHRDLIYVMMRHPGGVLAFDPNTNELKRRLFASKVSTFQRGCFVGNGDTVIFSIEGIPYICVLDFSTHRELIHRIPAFPVTLPYDTECIGNKVFISFLAHTPAAGEGLLMLDASNGFKLVKRYVPLFPLVELAADDDILYAASPILGRVLAFDANTLELVNSYKAPRGTRTIDIDPKNRLLYAGSFATGEIVQIDLKSKRTLRRWNIGPFVRNIRVAPKSGRVFATSQCGVFELVN